MIVAQPTALPMEECAEVEAANARSTKEFAVAAPVHSGWARADCSAVLPAQDSAPVGRPAELWADGWAPADYSAALPAHDSARAVDPAGTSADGSVPACLVPAGSVVLTAHGSTPADSSPQADRCGLRCSLDAPPAHSPVAELPHDSPERYKASPLVSREQPPGL